MTTNSPSLCETGRSLRFPLALHGLHIRIARRLFIDANVACPSLFRCAAHNRHRTTEPTFPIPPVLEISRQPEILLQLQLVNRFFAARRSIFPLPRFPKRFLGETFSH